jgi:branched-chain amino acid transport system substrate-binding protein
MRKFTVVCLTLALGLILATGAYAAETIKLAVMEPFSGNFKDIGDRYAEGVQYAAEVINAKGGINGRQVEVILTDTEVNPAVATRKATKLILQDNVRHFCGGTGSSVAGAMEALADKHNTLFFTYGMAAASLTGDKCNRNFFRTCANTDMQSYALATWVAEQGVKKVFCIAQDYSFGQEAVAAFVKKLKELSPQTEIVGQIMHPMGTKDFAP